MEKIALGLGLETNIALGENWFIVLAGLFDKLRRCFLGPLNSR